LKNIDFNHPFPKTPFSRDFERVLISLNPLIFKGLCFFRFSYICSFLKTVGIAVLIAVLNRISQTKIF